MWWILLDPIVYLTIIGYVVGSNVHGKHGSDKRDLDSVFDSDKVSAAIDTAFAKAGFDDDEAEAFHAGYHVGVDEFDDKDDESRKMLSVVLSKAIDAADVEKVDDTLDILGDKLDGLFPRDIDTTDGSEADVKDLPSVTEMMATLVTTGGKPIPSEKDRRKHAGKHDDHGKTAASDAKTDSNGHGPDNTLAKRWTPIEGVGKAMTEVMKGGIFEDLGDFLGSNTVHIDHPERAHSHEKRYSIRTHEDLNSTCDCEQLLKAIVEPKPKPLNWDWWYDWKNENFDGENPGLFCMQKCVKKSMDKLIKDLQWFESNDNIIPPMPNGTDAPPLPDSPPQKRDEEAIDHADPESVDSKLMVDPEEAEDIAQKQKLVKLYQLLKAKGLIKPTTRRPVTVEDVRAAMIAVAKANSMTASIGKVDPKLQFLQKMKAMGLLRRPMGNRVWTFKDFIQLLKDRKAQDDALRKKTSVSPPWNADTPEGVRENIPVRLPTAPQVPDSPPHLSKREEPTEHSAPAEVKMPIVQNEPPKSLFGGSYRDWYKRYKKTQKSRDLCTCDLKAPSIWNWITQIKMSKRCAKFCQQSVQPWVEKEKGLQAVPNEPSANSTTTAESSEETSIVVEDTTGADTPPIEPLEIVDAPEVPSSGQGQEMLELRPLTQGEPLPRPNEKPDVVHAPGLVNDN